SFSTTSTASIESYTLSLHDALPIYISKAKLRRHWFWGILIIIWFSTLFGFFVDLNDNLGGIVGFEVNTFLQDYIGKIGTILLLLDRKSTRLNSSHVKISYAVFCLKK